jgi:hypothetical protein
MLLAATHAQLGRTGEATSSAQRVMELEPGYSISGMCGALGLHPSIAGPLSAALRMAGLPM